MKKAEKRPHQSRKIVHTFFPSGRYFRWPFFQTWTFFPWPFFLWTFFLNTPTATPGRVGLRSAQRGHLAVRKTATELGKRSFHIWNTLPDHPRSPSISRGQFRCRLKPTSSSEPTTCWFFTILNWQGLIVFCIVLYLFTATSKWFLPFVGLSSRNYYYLFIVVFTDCIALFCFSY